MKVWKSWSGRPQRSSDDEHELVASIFGLDYAKSFVVRVRYEFSGATDPASGARPARLLRPSAAWTQCTTASPHHERSEGKRQSPGLLVVQSSYWSHRAVER